MVAVRVALNNRNLARPLIWQRQRDRGDPLRDDYKIQLPTFRRKGKKQNFDNLDVCFTRSNRGNNLLTINGKPFTLNRRIKDACYWECVKLRCKYIKCTARVVTKSDQISALRGQHNHP